MKSDIEKLLSSYNHAVADVQIAEDEVTRTAKLLANAVAEDGIVPYLSNEPAPKKRRKPTELVVPKKYIDREPHAAGCLCGCGDDPTTGSNFVRGHAHTLSAIVRFVEAGKLPLESIPSHAHKYLYGHEKVSKDLRSKLSYIEDAAE